ncbi:MAG: hypothetical protein M3Y35_18675 [Actinomycetota bacterium]|nr:hypothetical protein [Actinomycetota bacterium]
MKVLDAFLETRGPMIGLVRRVENMVADTANYRDELVHRRDHALIWIGELEAVADEAFEHTDELRDRRHRLDTLTAQLQMNADSPEAQARAAEHQQRLGAAGANRVGACCSTVLDVVAEIGVDPVEYKARITPTGNTRAAHRGGRGRSNAARTLGATTLSATRRAPRHRDRERNRRPPMVRPEPRLQGQGPVADIAPTVTKPYQPAPHDPARAVDPPPSGRARRGDRTRPDQGARR